MALKICIYEDDKYSQFFPLTLLRPVCLLRPGIVPLYRRIADQFGHSEVVLITRNSVSPLVADQARGCPVNIIKKGNSDILFLNGRIRDVGDLPRIVRESRLSAVLKNGTEVLGVLLKEDQLDSVSPIASVQDYLDLILNERDDIPDFDTTATTYEWCWEIMADISKGIITDFERMHSNLGVSSGAVVHEGVHFVNRGAVYLGHGASVLPGAVIDASDGPVYIGDNVRVEPHAAILGPCYIGPNTIVAAGKFTCCSIGHTCRVGGEIEESVFQAYVNKHHDGFIGHSYVGSWVNFGAMTTNSDLKNNYSTIRVTVDGNAVDTGSIKIGSFIGDHTKFGIGTLLTTGISIGVACNIFGGDLVSDKEVPSFSWGSTDSYVRYKYERAIETARTTMDRRSVQLSSAEEDVLRSIHDNERDDEGIVVIA
jgi:UDP-N-acetylglucosamine diphosphorylase/glucosamine-1-phosphate N-acetyltransferase